MSLLKPARLVLLLSVLGVAGALLVPATAGADVVIRPGVFTTSTDVLTWTVTASAPGTLTVETMDCCIPGDMWSSKITRLSVGPRRNSVPACGNGSITEFSGATHIPNYVFGRVENRYCHGVDIFPAGMSVRFSHPATLTVTP